MRRRLKNFLPIVLFALAVQVLAPIAACWAAVVSASDPLFAAPICHGDGAPRAGQQDDPSGAQGAEKGCCVLCGMLHTGAPIDPPQAAVNFRIDHPVISVVWHDLALDSPTSRAGSPEQARAPPVLS